MHKPAREQGRNEISDATIRIVLYGTQLDFLTQLLRGKSSWFANHTSRVYH